MKVHEILQQNADLLRALARAGAAIEDVRYIPLWSDYERLHRDGFKVAYIVACRDAVDEFVHVLETRSGLVAEPVAFFCCFGKNRIVEFESCHRFDFTKQS